MNAAFQKGPGRVGRFENISSIHRATIKRTRDVLGTVVGQPGTDGTYATRESVPAVGVPQVLLCPICPRPSHQFSLPAAAAATVSPTAASISGTGRWIAPAGLAAITRAVFRAVALVAASVARSVAPPLTGV